MTELPMGWRHAKLEDVATVTMGQSPPGSSYNTDGIGKPFFQGKAEFGETHPTVAKWTTSGTKFARPGDILMSVRAPVGPTNVADVDCVIGRGLAAITADPATVSQQYLIWVIKHLESEIASQGKGSTFDSISGVDLRGTLLPVPPLIEQKRIVEILEEQLSRLDSGLGRLDQIQRKVLQIARASRRDLIAGALTLAGTEEGIFSDYFKPKYGKSLPKEKRSSDGRYPVVGSAGVMAHTNEVLSEGPTIVIGRKGNVGQVEYFEEGCYPIDTTYYIQVTDGWDLQFLEFLLDSLELKNLDSSTATPSLRREDLESVSLVKPEIHTQKLLLKKLLLMSEGLASIEEILSHARLNAASLRRSLLHAAFTGQLTKEPANV